MASVNDVIRLMGVHGSVEVHSLEHAMLYYAEGERPSAAPIELVLGRGEVIAQVMIADVLSLEFAPHGADQRRAIAIMLAAIRGGVMEVHRKWGQVWVVCGSEEPDFRPGDRVVRSWCPWGDAQAEERGNKVEQRIR